MTTALSSLQQYYTTQSKISDPGLFAKQFQSLPKNLEQLREFIHGLLIHETDGKLFNIIHAPSRLTEINLRFVEKILNRIFELNSSPLTIRRQPKQRLIATCREFNLLLVSIMRHLGIPARLRIGFTKYGYTDPSVLADHAIAEYWNQQQKRWIKIDARISSAHINYKILSPNFDPLDISEQDFISPGQLWIDCQKGIRNPRQCGFGKELTHHGLWYIRNRLIQDLAALNKWEMLAWDVWGCMLNDPPFSDPSDQDQLQAILELATTLQTNSFSLTQLQTLWSNNYFRISKTIQSFSRYNQPQTIELCSQQSGISV